MSTNSSYQIFDSSTATVPWTGINISPAKESNQIAVDPKKILVELAEVLIKLGVLMEKCKGDKETLSKIEELKAVIVRILTEGVSLEL